jgi:TonB-linked SusC/RagA family outer membrane protein
MLMFSWARGNVQEDKLITINGKYSISQILRKIEEQTGKQIFYINTNLDDKRLLNLKISNSTIEAVMRRILEGTGLEFENKMKTILIHLPQKTISSNVVNLSYLDGDSLITVIGRVVDEKKNPIPGATIHVKGTSRGTTTANDGTFSIQNIPFKSTLTISSVQFLTKDVLLTGRSVIGNIELKEYIGALDETVVIAYGSTTRRYSTGNISRVKAEDIAKQPVNNPLLALAGRVPGLVVSQSTGFSGGGVRVLIQGQNSISKGNDPFYVVDGVPYINQLLPNLGAVLGSAKAGSEQFGNPLSFINPQDIESIEILKDADATAIYGSRAANGAILITTKKGRVGQMKVDLNLQTGWGKVTRSLHMLNTPQYLEMRKEAYHNDGMEIPNSMIPDDQKNELNYDLTFWDQNRNTDWQKELIGKTSRYNDAQLTISGGNNNTQYLVGVGSHKETTVFPGDLNDQKVSMHFNINSSSSNKKLRLSLSGNYLVDKNKLSTTDLTYLAVTIAPNAPALLNNDGSLNWARTPTGVSSVNPHPLAYLTQLYKNNTNNLIGNGSLTYEIIPGLDIQTSLGYSNLQTDELTTKPSTLVPPESKPFFNREAQYGNNNINSWIVEPQVRYNKRISNGVLDAIFGGTIQQVNSSRKLLKGTGYISDLVLENINAAKNVVVPDNSTIESIYKYNALFGRINYNWKEKYIINLTTRRDGTSRFGAENRFHNFGAVGAAWIFSNENWIRENTILSFGKLKVSYGTTGSDQIGDYEYLTLYSNNNPDIPYSGGTGLRPTKLPNPYLQWEQVKKISIGLDAGFFKDRILLNATYFDNKSSNQLLPYSLPPSTGFGGITSNFPATIKNTGWELTLNTINVQSAGFTWSTSINLTIPKNKLLSFKNLENSSYADLLSIGQPINIVKVYKFYRVNPTTGIYEFINNDKTITTTPFDSDKNKIVSINTNQTFYGGIQNTLKYKNFSLDLLFQFVKQKGNNYKFGNGFPGSFTPNNQPASVLDRWRNPGDVKPIQKYTQSNFDLILPALYIIQSDAAWTDASYIRLKNLSVSWQFPQKWNERLSLNNARLFMQGQNLLTITNYKGLDPETRSSTSLPPLRVLTLGIQITF